jgi:hypothetical protein
LFIIKVMKTQYIKKFTETGILKYRFLFLGVFLLAAILITSLVFTYNSNKENLIVNPDFLYNTWKVEKVYKNGKLVINTNKYNNLFFQVNRDGTAEWIKGDKKLKLSIIVSPNGGQIISDDGMRIEEIETIFELRQNVLRFGKRSLNYHYEYVMTAVDMKGGNFLE